MGGSPGTKRPTAAALVRVGVWLLCNIGLGAVGAFLMLAMDDTLKPWLLYGEPTTNEIRGMGGDALPFAWIMLVLGTALTVLLSMFVNRTIARRMLLPRGVTAACGIAVSLGVSLLIHFDVGWVLRQWFSG